jgi:tetratricopeptide (TPR) repeat protein
MKRNITFGIILMMLISLAGCHGGSSHYDQRLIEADSMLHHHPDSALQLLITLDASTLDHAGDRAYHALLLTQTRYYCYYTATSDSDINIALDYYTNHPAEKEKLTRAYIYKGAVMDELGQAEEAMKFYKQALSTASPDDAFNQGYIRMRMGQIYNDNFVADSSDRVLFKEALHFFQLVPDSIYIIKCLSQLGLTYALSKSDSAMIYLSQANALAKRHHLTDVERINKRYIIDLKLSSPDVKDIEMAKGYALSLLSDQNGPRDYRDHLLMAAALTLAKLNKPDSAKLYLKQVARDSLPPSQQVLYDSCLAELAFCQGDTQQYKHYFERANNMADSLLSEDLQYKLRDVETKYDNEALKYETLRYKTNWYITLLATALAVIVLFTIIMWLRRKLARRRQQLQENKDTIERLRNDTARLTTQLDANQTMSEQLKESIRHQIAVFSRLIEMHTTQYAHSPKKFAERFEKTYQMTQPDDSFWEGIRAYANSQCNNIITNTLLQYPRLIESDINFLSLYCCDLPTTVIMACMGYNEAHSLYNKKRRVANIMGGPDDLDTIIEKHKKH